MIRRFISVLVRQNKRRKSYKKLISLVESVMSEIKQLPKFPTKNKTLILVRMDEIGDYILSRNTFPIIRNSEKFRDFKIVYIGNITCKQLAESLDAAFIDSFIWVDKAQFVDDVNYRSTLFNNIRSLAASTIIELERTPDVNYGDLIVYVSDATKRYGSANYYQNDLLNNFSNKFYTDLYQRSWDLKHEFIFNQEYVNWICDTSIYLEKPQIDIRQLPTIDDQQPYILCVIGSSKKSKNWPFSYWTKLLQKLTENFNGKIILIGGKREETLANKIITENISPNIVSIVGKTTLMEAFSWIKNARLMISNDTFAIHAGASIGNPPTVVVANGESAFRFSELGNYADEYRVIYSTYYDKKKYHMKEKDQWFFSVPSVDMSTISVERVFESCKELLSKLS